MSRGIGLALLAMWLLVAAFGPMLAPHPVGAVVDPDSFGPISREFPFGTDYLGRDMLSRVLLGGRYTVTVALAAAGLACLTGASLGILAGVAGGWMDMVMSRLADAMISIPSLLFGLVAVAGLGAAVPVLIGTMALIYTPGCFRMARALAVDVALCDFVTAARVRGEGRAYLVFREILPNLVGPLCADFGLRFVYVILLLSGLSFLGLGIQPPAADLGSLVRENLAGLGYGAAALIIPAVAIATLTVGVNLLLDRRR